MLHNHISFAIIIIMFLLLNLDVSFANDCKIFQLDSLNDLPAYTACQKIFTILCCVHNTEMAVKVLQNDWD